MQRIVNESDYCKKRNASEAKKTDHGNEESIFFEKYQVTGALNYKQIFMHLLEIYTLYVTNRNIHTSLHIPRKLFL